ncbi:pre-rRNA-processing protein ESF2 [Selaginella moellendorffii]|uniref:pre-rRNA-processing protein ESF2 n=1 Tax=Selaginella moellendorffii TaxID=88036 RepID=UPI000D1C97C7|nr:pre-rRNA-processing protein ESF2 [Selaginella moellendorffii]|eukprot:XP_024543167.1 pre-rRNA-processing protein ESF2 [Selaginella moellendorffii]
MEEEAAKATKRKKNVAVEEKEEKKGVCYLSRIPPHLKPLKLRHLLSQYGDVLRVYLVPEDPAARKRRKRAGGNTGKNFTEGWVEFSKKSDAKHVAKLLNGEPMGGKRRSAYYYDLWNIKYLRKFKWNHLTEEIAYRKAVHDQKLAAEISAAKRERDFYLARVDQSKTIKAIQEKKKRKAGDPQDETSRKTLRRFSQTKSVGKNEEDQATRLDLKVLAGVFVQNEEQT